MDSWESDQPQWTETAKVLAHHKAKAERDFGMLSNPTPTKKRRKDLKNENLNREELCIEHNNARNVALSQSDINVRLLCGADLLESFGTPGLWKDEDIEEIVSKYGLICITREGSDPRKFIYESDVLTKYQENIHIVTEWIHNDISSTKISESVNLDRREKTVPPIPSTRPTIQLSDKFQLTTSGETFLQADDGDDDKILIFTTADNIDHLCAATDIYCDGTFYT